jgi:uncharacterized protein
MPRDPRSVIQAFYEAFADQHYETSVAPFLTHDVVWHVAGNNPLAGTFTGVDEALAAMRAYGRASDHSLHLDTMTLLADDHHVVAVHDASATAGDFSYRAHEVDVFHLRGEQIEAFWSFSEDQPATDRLWSIGA